MNFAFGGCGWLMAYSFGFARRLQLDQRHLLKTARFGGASGGSLVSTVLALDFCAERAHKLLLHSAMQQQGQIARGWGNHGAHLRAELESGPLLTTDAHERATQHGNLHIVVSHVSVSQGIRGVIVSEFPTRTHLIDTLIASCHVPLYTSFTEPLVHVDGIGYCLDGGLTLDAPILDEKTFLVSPFPAFSPLQGIQYDVVAARRSPHQQEQQTEQQQQQQQRRSLPWLLRAAFTPRVADLDEMFLQGDADAVTFFQNLPSTPKHSQNSSTNSPS